MSNPGPASSNIVSYPLVNNQQALVLIGVYKGLPLSAAGDFSFQVPTILNFVPTTVVTTNSSGSTVNVAAATVGVYTQPAQGGTAVLTTAALTGQTTQAFAYVRAATAAAAYCTVQSGVLYANIGTTVSGGVVDLYVYGYNVS